MKRLAYLVMASLWGLGLLSLALLSFLIPVPSDGFAVAAAGVLPANSVVSAGGNFVDSGQLLGNDFSTDVALGDLDLDGDLDAFVTNSAVPNQVWFNQGGAQAGTPGTFQDSGQSVSALTQHGVSLGDVDGDSDLDVFILRGFPADSLQIWLNQGGEQGGSAGTFLSNLQMINDELGVHAALGDIDGDGDLDAYVSHLFDEDRLYLNDGLGNFNDSGRLLADGDSRGAALADLDGDGDLDVFVAGDGANSVWLNQGGAQGGVPGTYLDTGQALGNDNSLSVALADLDGDGDADAFVANTLRNRVWLNRSGEQGNPAGTFVDSGQLLGFSGSLDVKLADLDADGDVDAFVANAGPNKVWINQGGIQGGTPGTFLENGQSLGEYFSNGVGLGDVDADGDVDAFVANASAQNLPNRVYLNGGLNAPGADWQIQTLDVRGDVGQDADIALDSFGHPHIAYYERTPTAGRLKYARWDGISWHVEVVDEEGHVGQYAAIALDDSDRPHISYYDVTNGDLKYAQLLSGGWQVVALATAGATGRQTDIAFAGHVHITYIDTNENLVHVAREVGQWRFRVVRPSLVSTSHSLAVDGGGVPHISYYDNRFGGDLRYASLVGDTWEDVPVDLNSDSGRHSALAFTPDGQPRIAYTASAGEWLMYAGSVDGGNTWSVDFLTTGLSDVRALDLAVDGGGVPHVAYPNAGAMVVARKPGPGDWLFADVPDSYVGQLASLALDITDRAHLVYYDRRFSDLKYAADAAAWQVRPLFTGGVDAKPAIALENNVPAVALRSVVNSPANLFLAQWQNPAWALDPITFTVQLPYEVGLAFDPAGQAHVAYFENGAVHYASWNGSQWLSEPIFQLPAGGVMGERLDLIWRDAGPVVVYSYAVGNTASLEVAEPAESGGWNRHATVFGGLNEPFRQIAADATGRGDVIIAFTASGADILRLLRWNGQQWVTTVVEAGVAATAVTVAVDRNHRLNGTPDIVVVGFHDAFSQELRLATSLDGSYANWDRTPVQTGVTGVSGLALALAENAASQPRLAYVDAGDNRLLLAEKNGVGESWQLETLLPAGGPPRTHLSFAYGERERLVVLEGDAAFHLFRTENTLTAPAQSGSGSVGGGTLYDGGMCAFLLDPEGYCFLFEDPTFCFSNTVQGPAVIPSNLAVTSSGSELPGDIGVLADVTTLFGESPAGQAFLDLYAQHDSEITDILVSDAGLLWDGYRTLQDFMPGLEALAAGQGSFITVTQEMADNALSVWTRIADAASPALAAVISDQLAQSNDLQDFVDGSFDDWALSIGVTPPSHRLYLPWVAKEDGSQREALTLFRDGSEPVRLPKPVFLTGLVDAVVAGGSRRYGPMPALRPGVRSLNPREPPD